MAHRVGVMYSLNVAGAIAGSLGAGFLLLPLIGSVNALIALAALFVASGLWLLSTLRRPGFVRWAVAAAIALAFVLIARALPDPFEVAIDRRYGNQLLEFWRHEGPQTAVSVRASEFQHVLYLDGLHQANDQPAMVRLHRAIGHLPMVLHGNPKEVLVVGLGGGATPGAVSQYPNARVDVVELSDGVRQAATFFKHVNYDLLTQPNVTVRIDDGRNFLALTDRRFDVITADIIDRPRRSRPRVFTRVLLAGARRPQGQQRGRWIGSATGRASSTSLIMRTFLEVFPDATLWYNANFMVGTRRPLTLDPGALDRLREHPQTRAALNDVGLTSWAVLQSWYTAGPAEMRAFVGDGPLLTDDRPLVGKITGCRGRRTSLPSMCRASPATSSVMSIETVFLDAGGVLCHPSWTRVADALVRHGAAVTSAALTCSCWPPPIVVNVSVTPGNFLMSAEMRSARLDVEPRVDPSGVRTVISNCD